MEKKSKPINKFIYCFSLLTWIINVCFIIIGFKEFLIYFVYKSLIKYVLCKFAELFFLRAEVFYSKEVQLTNDFFQRLCLWYLCPKSHHSTPGKLGFLLYYPL